MKGVLRRTIATQHGPYRQQANGTVCYDWVFYTLSCGHRKPARSFKAGAKRPTRMRCLECEATA